MGNTNSKVDQKSKSPMLFALLGLLVLIVVGCSSSSEGDKPVEPAAPVTEVGAAEAPAAAPPGEEVKLPETKPVAKRTGTPEKFDQAEVDRLKKSISDVKLSTKRILHDQQLLVANKKKEIVGSGALVSLRKQRENVTTRMFVWEGHGGKNMEEIRSIEAAAKKYEKELKAELGNIFKSVKGMDSGGTQAISDLFASDENTREKARKLIADNYADNGPFVLTLIKRLESEFNKNPQSPGVFTAYEVMVTIAQRHPGKLYEHKTRLLKFLEKAKAKGKYDEQTQSRINFVIEWAGLEG